MKKLFTLTMLLVFGLAVYAQDNAYTLTKNRVIYLTCDTIYYDEQFPDEPIEWSANFLQNPFNAAGMAISGTDATDWNYQVAFRNDYTDPETGFTINKGYYKGITLMEDKLCLYGEFFGGDGTEHNYSNGYKNLKKAILYFVPLPNAKCTTYGYNYAHDRLPSNGGRIEAQYMNADGTAKSNNAYRDATVGTKVLYSGTPCEVSTEHPDGFLWDEYLYDLSNCALNYEALSDDAFASGYNAALVTFDQPFKLAVDLSNALRSTRYEDLLAEGKKEDFVSLGLDGLTEAEMSYYFAEAGDSNPTTDNPDADYTSASGYNKYTDKWGKKVSWSADTPIRIAIKRRLYLIGIGLVCGTEGAETEYVNIGDYNDLNPTFTTEKIAAFGLPVADMPDDPWASRRFGEKSDAAIHNVSAAFAADAPVYNLQGQRVSADTKGILVSNGKKFVNK